MLTPCLLVFLLGASTYYGLPICSWLNLYYSLARATYYVCLTADCLRLTAYGLLLKTFCAPCPTMYFMFTADNCSRITAYHILRTTYHSRIDDYEMRLATWYLLLVTCYLRLMAYDLRLTTTCGLRLAIYNEQLMATAQISLHQTEYFHCAPCDLRLTTYG